MTNYVSNITIDQVIEALATWLAPFMPAGGQVVRGQVNRVPLPSNPCAVLTEMINTDLWVPMTDYQPTDGTATIHGPTRIDVQIDFYGEEAGELAKVAKTAFRSSWGFNSFPSFVKPLYTSDAVQGPLTTGEQQYESRWTLTVSMQYNPTVTVPQTFADVLTPNVPQAVDVVLH